MNETYTAQNEAQKGFKTFILTLSVSLIVFSIVYYFISDTQSGNDIAKEQTTEEVQAAVTEDLEEDTVFSKIASAPVATTSRAVLAGTTTSPTAVGTTSATTSPTVPETTVPATGVTQLTWGFFVSLLAFALGFIVISRNPRGLALEHFERKMLKD